MLCCMLVLILFKCKTCASYKGFIFFTLHTCLIAKKENAAHLKTFDLFVAHYEIISKVHLGFNDTIV